MSEEIQRSLGRIEGKMDLLLNMQDDHTDRLDKHEARLTAVEKQSGKLWLVAVGIWGVVIAYGAQILGWMRGA